MPQSNLEFAFLGVSGNTLLEVFMARQRRHFTPEQKVALLRLHLLEKKPVSDLCEEHSLSVTLFYLWQKQFFDNGAAAFANSGNRQQAVQDSKDRKITALEDKLQRKNEVLAELMEEHVALKKELGEP
jgi:transposase-like protein